MHAIIATVAVHFSYVARAYSDDIDVVIKYLSVINYKGYILTFWTSPCKQMVSGYF